MAFTPSGGPTTVLNDGSLGAYLSFDPTAAFTDRSHTGQPPAGHYYEVTFHQSGIASAYPASHAKLLIDGSNRLQNLVPGTAIDSGSGTFDYHWKNDTVNFVQDGSTPGYLGFVVLANGSHLTAGNHYGWAKITESGTGLTLDAWAYNAVAGQSIQAGQTSAIPEPAHAATLLAAGAVGLAAYRRRRQAA